MDSTTSEARSDWSSTRESPWHAIRARAQRVLVSEAILSRMLETDVLVHASFEEALARKLARKLADGAVPERALHGLLLAAMARHPCVAAAAEADLTSIRTRDPAADDLLTPFLYYKGFHALQTHRVAHALWREGRQEIGHHLQSRVSEVFAVDIHPAVPVGRGVFIDHATGLVVGETAVIGNDVSILQGVTLGGTGKETGDRHPKVRDGVLLSAGATILGNIEIGRGAKVGAGSVVLTNVPPCATVAGVPARIVGWCKDSIPALAMDQSLPQRPETTV